ncbi:MAG: FecR domain-containing protein [Candidatus Omnitrophica bacterium]|nr:FecR domain-containing protein [Candidatus Omnitrophota bacterium]
MKIKRFLLTSLFILLVSGCARTEEKTCFLGPNEAAIISVEGDVKVIADGEEKKAEEGMIIKAGDKVKTAAGSSAEIAYDGACKNLTRLDENTEMAVTAVSPTRLEMTMGRLFAGLEALKKDEPFEVRTPTCVAAVRGTEFDVAIKDGESEVRSFQNEVTVYGIDKEGKLFDGRPLKAGGKIGVGRFMGPGNVFKMQKGEWKEGRNFGKMMRGRVAQFKQRSGGRSPFVRGRQGGQGPSGVLKRQDKQQGQGQKSQGQKRGMLGANRASGGGQGRGLLGKVLQQSKTGLGANRTSGGSGSKPGPKRNK